MTAVSSGPLRVAAWQCASRPEDVAGNLARLGALCERLAGEPGGVDVVVTPELFVTGYDIGAEATSRLAEPPDGPIAQAVAETTRRTGVAVVYGYPERGPAGEIYNAAQLIDVGRVVAGHRKAHLFGDLDRSRFAPAPEAPRVSELRGHLIGMLICYDVEFPEPVRSLALAGAEAVLVPTANMVGYELVPEVLVRARAYESGCYVAYANYCGAEGDQTYAGLSTICAPDGSVLGLAGADEQVLVATLGPVEGSTHLADRRGDLFDR